MTRLHDLYNDAGQSPWLDNLKRSWIESGEIQRWVDDGGHGFPHPFQRGLQDVVAVYPGGVHLNDEPGRCGGGDFGEKLFPAAGGEFFAVVDIRDGMAVIQRHGCHHHGPGQRAAAGVGPPSVPVTRNSWPCRWIGWLVIVRLPTRRRTRSPRRTLSESMPGKMRLFHDQRLKSSMVMILGV